MYSILESPALILLTVTMSLVILQLAVNIASIFALRSNARERADNSREFYGLVRKMEGLTAERREQMLNHYDKILENLSNKLPVLVAGQAGQKIFDAESKILSRLAEIEPLVKGNEAAHSKMDELIRTMEGLETTIITVTSEAVKQVLTEGRRELLDDDRLFGCGGH